MLGYNMEVNAVVVVTPILPEEDEIITNTPPKIDDGGGYAGHGLGTPKTCSLCGRVGVNRRTHPLHGDGADSS